VRAVLDHARDIAAELKRVAKTLLRVKQNGLARDVIGADPERLQEMPLGFPELRGFPSPFVLLPTAGKVADQKPAHRVAEMRVGKVGPQLQRTFVARQRLRVAGPLFYLGHEAAWNYLGPPEAADLPVAVGGGLTVSRALAKTVTFRTIASVMDFTTNYVVVGDVAAAVVLSASGFILGPFVYFGHERAWDYFSAPRESTVDPPASIKLVPAPG
jgi:uncharacterized membrane protein